MEGDEYWERLRELRREALRIMSALSDFKPRLVGSVWRGVIKPDSDIDIELDFANPDPVRRKLLEEGYEIIEDAAIDAPEPLRCGSLWRIRIMAGFGREAEIILKEHEWYVSPPKCGIYGDVRKGLNLMELRKVLETEPDKLFIPGGASMEIDRKTFRKLFPNLYREMELKKMSISIDAVRLDEKEAEKEASRPRGPTMPTPIDYLRRCEDDSEALEVIDYLEKRGEVTKEQAEKLRRQVAEHGVRSFGKKKEWGYYSAKYLGDGVEE